MVACLAFVFGWIPLAFALQTEAEEEAAVRAIGVQFFQHLANREYQEAVKLVSPHIASALNPTALEMSWIGESRGLGVFLRVVESKPNKSGIQRWADVEGEWERGRRSLRVIVTDDKQIIGMQWIPLERPAPDLDLIPPGTSAAAKEIAVTIGAEPWVLPAVLTLPSAGDPKAAVVVVHDAGAFDRDGSVGQNKPYRSLANGLAEQEVATLRFDKRTWKYASKLAKTPTHVQDEVLDDAAAAVAFIRQHPETSKLPVYVVGHGRGGTLAPYIALADGKLSGIVLLAATARSTEDALRDQLEYLAALYQSQNREDGKSELQIERVNALRARTVPEEDSVLQVKASFWYDLFDRDADAAVKVAASLPCRILVCHPGRDFESVEEDFELWKYGLSKNPNATFRKFDDLNHVFAKGRGKSTPQEHGLPNPVDPSFVEFVADWCKKVPTSPMNSTP